MSDDNQYSVFHSGPERYFALRRAATASFIGNFIEWFDYASYGYLAAVIGDTFFPDSDKSVQLMLAFAVFAMSFILRPIGAVVWGAPRTPLGALLVDSHHVGLDLPHRSPAHLRHDRDLGRPGPSRPAHGPGLLRLRRVRRGRHLPGRVRTAGASRHLHVPRPGLHRLRPARSWSRACSPF